MGPEGEFLLQILHQGNADSLPFGDFQIPVLKFRNVVYHIALAQLHAADRQMVRRGGGVGLGYSQMAILSVAAAKFSTALVITGLNGLWGTRLA